MHDGHAVVDRSAIIKQQHRNLSQRIIVHQRGRLGVGVNANGGYVDVEMTGRHAHLGGVGGGGRIEQFHGWVPVG